MFGIFKKSKWKIEGKAYTFFNQVFKELPAEYQFLLDGLNIGLYNNFRINAALKDHFFSVGFNSLYYTKSIIKGKHLELKDIEIIQNGSSYTLSLSVYDGIWIGFRIEKNVFYFENFQIDLSNIKRIKASFAPQNKVKKLLEGLSSKHLDFNDLGELEIDSKLYYQIKDLEDGNYLAIDESGKVFSLIHESNQIKLIDASISNFANDVNMGTIDFNKYFL